MKKIFTILFAGSCIALNAQQQVYMDFEGTKVAALAEWGGTMDSMAVNPATNTINSSAMCGMYTRGTDMYDNFKIFPYTKLEDVTPYAVAGSTAPKITMKLYTTAPAGTRIDLQLGARTVTTYPEGVHSEYTATTTTSGAWELLTFEFVKIPTGSMVNPVDVDKIVVLPNPATTATGVYYFDDPTGPQLTVIGLAKNSEIGNSFSTAPNPAGDRSHIRIELKKAADVVLTLTDLTGRVVRTLHNGPMAAGTHNLQAELAQLPSGTYFYQLKTAESVQTSKLIIAH